MGDERTTFDRHIGMEMEPDAPDDCVAAKIEIQPHHCNPTGFVNGGVIISLADNIATGMANRAYTEKTGERAFMPPRLDALEPEGRHGSRRGAGRARGPSRDGHPHSGDGRRREDPRGGHDDARTCRLKGQSSSESIPRSTIAPPAHEPSGSSR